MPETIVKEKWQWFDVAHDLEVQGGLADVVIDPLSVVPHSCGGQYQSNPFFISWVRNNSLLVTMKQFSQQLVDAFAKVVGYQPFCRYKQNDMETVEWDKFDSDLRFEELKKESGVTELVAFP